MRLLLVAGLLAACAEPHDEPLRALASLSVDDPAPRSAVVEGTIPPPWEAGLTWMLRERCHTHYSLDDRGPPESDWPSYVFMKVLRVSPEELEVGRWPRRQPKGKPYGDMTRFIIRRDTFRISRAVTESGEHVDLGWRAVVTDSDSSAVKAARYPLACGIGSGWAGICLLGLAGQRAPADRSLADGLVQERVYRLDNGVMFQFWRPGEDAESRASVIWRSGEPFWEDSLGCTKLVRDREGRPHRPKNPEDFGPEEPRVVKQPEFRMPDLWTTPTREMAPDARPFPPRWEVGMRWMTRSWCTDGQMQLDPVPLGAALPVAKPDRPVYAQYVVVGATENDFTILETKHARTKGITRFDRRMNITEVIYRFRRRPFGVMQWWRVHSDVQLAYEYKGGPCLNVDARVDQCPFAMPASAVGPEDESSWIAKQTVHERPWGMEFSYDRPSSPPLTIRWRRGEPWPEASPSCTKLVRDDDGRVRLTRWVGDHEDDYHPTAAYAEDQRIESKWQRQQ